jgi:hypothetical protein
MVCPASGRSSTRSASSESARRRRPTRRHADLGLQITETDYRYYVPDSPTISDVLDVCPQNQPAAMRLRRGRVGVTVVSPAVDIRSRLHGVLVRSPLHRGDQRGMVVPQREHPGLGQEVDIYPAVRHDRHFQLPVR